MEGRVGNLIGRNLRGSLNDFRKYLQNLRIRGAVIGFRVFLLVPQAEGNGPGAAGGDERDFVLEATLCPEKRKDVLSTVWINLVLSRASNHTSFPSPGWRLCKSSWP